MTGVIFHKMNTNKQIYSTCTDDENDAQHHMNTTRTTSITCSEQVWGIVPKGGSVNHPLPTGVSKHFSNLMFNARSDTLYEKRTFRDLALKGNTCICAIDGFFEWNQPEKNVLSKDSGKQPYYVHRKDGLPLLIPGLFCKVKTGRMIDGQEEMLETFTLMTTGAMLPLQWLHHRQPVLIFDSDLAMQWLCSPSKELVDTFSSLASGLTEKESCLVWHPVTKEMSKVGYRDANCVDPVNIEKVPSVKSFFAANKGTSTSTPQKKGNINTEMGIKNSPSKSAKRKLDDESSRQSPLKNVAEKQEAKKGCIEHFLSQGNSGVKSPPRNKPPIKRKEEKKGSITHFFSKQNK